MAERTNKVGGNAAGRFYVDENCIHCGVCIEIEPRHFATNEDEGYAYVARQPEDETAEALFHEAIDECPVEAIGDDG